MANVVKLMIDGIFNAETKEKCKETKYRVGRTVYLDLDYVAPRVPLILIYNYEEDDKHFVTTAVQKIEEDDYGFLITTRNRIYRLNYVTEKGIT